MNNYLSECKVTKKRKEERGKRKEIWLESRFFNIYLHIRPLRHDVLQNAPFTFSPLRLFFLMPVPYTNVCMSK